MRVLLVGDDAVAHAVAKRLVEECELFVSMEEKNPGILKIAKKTLVASYHKIKNITSWAKKQKIELAVITNETAMNQGVADALKENGIDVASPTAAEASVGNNRAYARRLLRGMGIFPAHRICKNTKEVKSALEEFGYSVLKSVVRNDWQGLTFQDIRTTKITQALAHGKALIKKQGAVVVEEYIDGEEVTIQVFTDGRTVIIGPQTHGAKHAQEGDTGEHTEGMASYSLGTHVVLRKEECQQVESVLRKIIGALKKRGVEYHGIIHARFMISTKGVRLLDIRTSFGNPEGINCLMLLKGSLLEVFRQIATQTLCPISFDEYATIVKYAVPVRYPKKGTKNKELIITDQNIQDSGAQYYVQNLRTVKNKTMLDSAHRSVAVAATGETIDKAVELVERALATLRGEIRWRTDVGTPEYLQKRMKRGEAIRNNFRYLMPTLKIK